MTTRSDYEAALRVVSAVLDEWDPYSLRAGGAPPDEFSAEAAALIPRIRFMHSAQDAACEVAAVFSAAFELESFSSEKCAEVGARLFSRLSEANLLHA